jgi:hypothetical protein
MAIGQNDWKSKIRDPGGQVNWISASHDGKWLAFQGGSIWNLQTGQEKRIEAGSPAAFSPRAPLLAAMRRPIVAGKRAYHLVLWNVSNEEKVWEVSLDSDFTRLAFPMMAKP